MKNENDIDVGKNSEPLENVSHVNKITPEAYETAKLSGIMQLETLVATYGHYKAELTAEYWWGKDGGLLYGYAKQYRVTSNGNKNGNLTFGVHGTSGQSWQNELTFRAVQDGNWHDIRGGGWVGCPLMTGWLYFKYVFDRSDTWDPAAETTLKVAYP